MLKPQVGAYRQILVKHMEQPIADAFAEKRFSLGIVSTFVGNVVVATSLIEPVKACFRSLPNDEIAQYYLKEMEEGRATVVANQSGTYQPNKIYASGELFFTS
jgi:hypothetical protein